MHTLGNAAHHVRLAGTHEEVSRCATLALSTWPLDLPRSVTSLSQRNSAECSCYPRCWSTSPNRPRNFCASSAPVSTSGRVSSRCTPARSRSKLATLFQRNSSCGPPAIKAPDFLAGIDGLESDRSNRLVVRPTMQTTRDDDVFAIGDCASCLLPGSEIPLPPRAQTAHQQASYMSKVIEARLKKRPPPTFSYRDFGSLMSLSDYRTFGNLAIRRHCLILLKNRSTRLRARYKYGLKQIGSMDALADLGVCLRRPFLVSRFRRRCCCVERSARKTDRNFAMGEMAWKRQPRLKLRNTR